ncbi:hypothetical protein Taro_032301 [Colocasia esculenta]|uniref:Pentatricopeptide repeat-containing protein n=1 Tax=Colocasia esculenta TaxID=4460 RepID=A0A843W5R4_COLES|nr:hypothetical protein [Colocasia esculenta]
MAGATRFRVSGLLRSLNPFETSYYASAAMLPQAHPSPCNRSYGSAPDRPVGGGPVVDPSEDDFLRSLKFGGKNGGDGRGARDAQRSSSSGAFDRPVRGDKRLDDLFPGDDADENVQRSGRGPPVPPPISRPMRGEGWEGIPPRERTSLDEGFSGGRLGSSRQSSWVDTVGRPSGGFGRGERSGNLPAGDLKMNGQSAGSLGGEKRGDLPVSSLLQKLKFGWKADEEKAREKPPGSAAETDAPLPESSSQDADEIFRKMKETGLIPNAVAMLDGLCKDGLIQEAMKLFGLMREKGTIPEVVIYTAVVEGFCKAAKYDDAKRVFRKMLNNGISPNAFSYKVLIEGLFRGKRLEDSVDLCLEMLDFGQSPSVATFTGLVDELCKEKGVEEAESVVRRLRERGLALDDKSIREHLDKKGPISPLVWEAIFGKKVSKRPF